MGKNFDLIGLLKVNTLFNALKDDKSDSKILLRYEDSFDPLNHEEFACFD